MTTILLTWIYIKLHPNPSFEVAPYTAISIAN